MIDQQLSDLSDLAFEGAMAGYLVALVSHAVEYGSRKVRTRAAEPAVVGGGAGRGGAVGAAGTESRMTNTAAGPRRTVAESFGRGAVIVTALGLIFQVAAIVLRGMAASRGPWGNMYEFTLLVTAAAIAGWLVVVWRTGARQLGIYVLTPITVLIFLAGTVLYTQSAPLQPILNVYWLHIHVIVISLSSGILMLAGFASAAYLVRVRHDERVSSGALTEDKAETRLPDADKLDRIAYRSAIAAFPFFTFSIIAGALWAEAAWGRYWGWDPKETVALVTWVVFAGYLHARATAGWRGKPAAWISVVGLATILFNLFFVNMVVSGLHSYAGLN